MTPTIEEFLRVNPEGVVWDEAGYRLFREIVERGKGNTAAERAGRFGASSRGKCERKQIFTFLGMPGGRLLDAETQNLFNDGKWRHLRWQMMGVQSGALTHAEWPTTMKKYRVKVSMDGLNANDAWIFELKGDRDFSRSMTEVPEDHDLQIHTMLLATGWDRASYVMEDKKTQQWREIVITRNPATIVKVRDELERLNDHVERHVLPDVLPACTQGAGPYRTCDYGPQCIERWRDHGDTWPDIPGDWES